MEDKSEEDRVLESLEIDAFDLLDRKMEQKALEKLHRQVWTKTCAH